MCDLVEDTERLLWGKLRVSDAGLTSNQATGRAGGGEQGIWERREAKGAWMLLGVCWPRISKPP